VRDDPTAEEADDDDDGIIIIGRSARALSVVRTRFRLVHTISCSRRMAAASAEAATSQLRQTLNSAAIAAPDGLPALVKDVTVLLKLIRNPSESPDEPKFRRIKLSNATVGRVLAHAGAREVLSLCGFQAAGSEFMELGEVSEAAAAQLLGVAQAVESECLQHVQELQWLHAERAAIPSLAAQPWAADGCARAFVQTCLHALHTPGTAEASKAGWVRRLHFILSEPGMRASRDVLGQLGSVAVPAVRRVVLELIHAGAHDVQTLVLATKSLAQLWPPGEPSTLSGRLDFCFACLEAALPADHLGDAMELRLRLVHNHLLSSTIEGLGAFSEVGIRCGVLRQELTIEYEGQEGQDAGGLLRQFFDLFTLELQTSELWAQTAAGGLVPADAAAASQWGTAAAAAQSPTAQLRPHMETCGRVCGMALYQELHRRRNAALQMMAGGSRAPYVFGAAFARHFIRAVQHDPPASLEQLQAELRAESVEAQPDFRGTPEILSRSVAESGLQDQAFVRSVGPIDVPLVEGGAAIPVTDANKREWLERLLRSELVEAHAEAASHFRKGLVEVVGMVGSADPRDPEQCRWSTPHFFLLSAHELQQQWSGEPVSRAFVEELRRVAVVHPTVRVQADWLWEVMLALEDEPRRKLCRFVTGSSRRPNGGVADFRIGPKEGGDGAFPFAHACANALDMPSYSSMGVLRERLETAVEAAHDKFTDL